MQNQPKPQAPLQSGIADGDGKEFEAIEAFAVLNNRYICTANKDGSIPVTSRYVVEIGKNNLAIDLLRELIRRANAHGGTSFSHSQKGDP